MARPRAFDHELARALRSEGWALRAIGARCGVSHVAVWRAVREIPPIWQRKCAP